MISKFEPQPTALAEWHHLIQLAQAHSGYHFEENLEHYIMITLDSFTHKVDLGSNIIAIDYLQHQNIESAYDLQCLRNTGDQCLILAGLFTENIKHKYVSTNYIINIGRSCYDRIAAMTRYKLFDQALFAKLRDHFVDIIVTVHQMRTGPELKLS